MDEIGTIGSGGVARSAATGRGFSAMTSDEFSKIIFTELANQDPLQPNDTGALLEQISTLRSIEADTNLSERLKRLVSQNEFASAAGLLGKRVGGIALDNARVRGTVASVARTSEGPVLTLSGGERINMSNLDFVHGEGTDTSPDETGGDE